MEMETYYGIVRTPHDAIILFEACRRGMLPRVQRRLSEKERHSIRSGSVFVWDEREAGMRRWTDGKSWSASRVSGSFLTYREMVGKQRTEDLHHMYQSNSATSNGNQNQTQHHHHHLHKSSDYSDHDYHDDNDADGYVYKPDGLMKQSFSITTSTNVKLHLISYFSRQHANSHELKVPSQDVAFESIVIPKGLYPENSSSGQVDPHQQQLQQQQHHHPQHPGALPPQQMYPIRVAMMHPQQSGGPILIPGGGPPPPPPPGMAQGYPYMPHVIHPAMPVAVQAGQAIPMYHHPSPQPPLQPAPLPPPSSSSAAAASSSSTTGSTSSAPHLQQPPSALPPRLGYSLSSPSQSPQQSMTPEPHNLPPPNIVAVATSPNPSLRPNVLDAQDIPFDKVRFNEDERAIQVLDRRFAIP